MVEMEIRKSRVGDLDRMMEIFAAARAFMAANGNPRQWGDGYPQRAAQTDYIRIDTHEQNRPMQQALTRYGFQRCGDVVYEEGKERIAFDLVKKA